MVFEFVDDGESLAGCCFVGEVDLFRVIHSSDVKGDVKRIYGFVELLGLEWSDAIGAEIVDMDREDRVVVGVMDTDFAGLGYKELDVVSNVFKYNRPAFRCCRHSLPRLGRRLLQMGW